MAITNAIELRLRWTIPDVRDMVNVLHLFSLTPEPTVDQALAVNVAAIVATQYQATPSIRASQHTSVRLEDIQLRPAWTGTAPAYVSTVGLNGLASADRLPPQNALVVTLRTNRAGRSGRGRIYFGGYTEGSSDAQGRIALATANNAQNWVANLSSALVSGVGMPLGVLSRKEQEIRVVQQAVVRDRIWDTQRRRARPLD
jgi:hypothetical protein